MICFTQKRRNLKPFLGPKSSPVQGEPEILLPKKTPAIAKISRSFLFLGCKGNALQKLLQSYCFDSFRTILRRTHFRGFAKIEAQEKAGKPLFSRLWTHEEIKKARFFLCFLFKSVGWLVAILEMLLEIIGSKMSR